MKSTTFVLQTGYIYRLSDNGAIFESEYMSLGIGGCRCGIISRIFILAYFLKTSQQTSTDFSNFIPRSTWMKLFEIAGNMGCRRQLEMNKSAFENKAHISLNFLLGSISISISIAIALFKKYLF